MRFIKLNYFFEPMDERKPLSGPCLIRVDDITCVLPGFRGCRIGVNGVTIDVTDSFDTIMQTLNEAYGGGKGETHETDQG